MGECKISSSLLQLLIIIGFVFDNNCEKLLIKYQITKNTVNILDLELIFSVIKIYHPKV